MGRVSRYKKEKKTVRDFNLPQSGKSGGDDAPKGTWKDDFSRNKRLVMSTKGACRREAAGPSYTAQGILRQLYGS